MPIPEGPQVSEAPIPPNRAQRAYWRSAMRVTLPLLLLWLLITFGGSWFAHDLDVLQLGDFPLGFWIASQGLLLLFVLIIAVYAWCMERLEARDPALSAEDGEQHG